MHKLNDTQSIILSGAAQRESGSLHPLPDTLTAGVAKVTKAIAALVTAGMAEERETSDRMAVHRSDGDLGYGLFVTATGLAALGLGDGVGEGDTNDQPAAAPRTSKSAAVLALLQREDGATLDELIEATGWLLHTTRAALTGLRKKGHDIARGKRGSDTCYKVAA